MTAPAPTDTNLTVFRSYLELDPRHGATLGMLTDAHSGHQLTMAPFAYALEHKDFFTGHKATGRHPDHRKEHNVLWAASIGKNRRTPDGEKPAPVKVLVYSDIEPDFGYWRFDDYRPALLRNPIVGTVELGADEGQVIEYQIIANPRRNVNANGHRKTIVARTEDQVTDWWTRRSKVSGLTLTSAPVIDHTGTLVSAKKPGLTLSHCRITGKARVTDPALYLQAQHEGIGAGKAYGFGLLLTR